MVKINERFRDTYTREQRDATLKLRERMFLHFSGIAGVVGWEEETKQRRLLERVATYAAVAHLQTTQEFMHLTVEDLTKWVRNRKRRNGRRWGGSTVNEMFELDVLDHLLIAVLEVRHFFSCTFSCLTFSIITGPRRATCG